MQFKYVVAVIAVLLSMCFHTDSHYYGSEWILVKPSEFKQIVKNDKDSIWKGNKEFINEEKVKTRKTLSSDINDEDTDAENYKTDKRTIEHTRKKKAHSSQRRLRKVKRFKRDYESREFKSNDVQNETPAYAELRDNSDLYPQDISNGSINLNELEEYLEEDAVPILILKIRMSLMKQAAGNDDYLNAIKRFSLEENIDKSDSVESNDEQSSVNEMKKAASKYHLMDSIESKPTWSADPEIETIYVTRGRLPSSQPYYLPENYLDSALHSRYKKGRGSSAARQVTKRMFSFLSRVQGMHSAKDMEHRRHFHSYGGFPILDRDGDIVSAETRALLRPPGSPLRWG